MIRPVVALYGALLLLLPAALRRSHGGAMKVALLEQLREARGRGRGPALRVAWLACFDVLRRATYEHVRRQRSGAQPVRKLMTGALGFELRQAVRVLLRQPGTSLLVVIMLTLGIGANTVVFTMVNGLFLRPLPFHEPDRLVYLNEMAPKWNLEYTGINYPDFDTWRTSSRVFEGMALYGTGNFNLSEGDAAERVAGLMVTHDYLAVVGLRPVLGRSFLAEEDRPDQPRVALISHDLWRTRYAASETVLGRTLRVNSEAHTIVGVLPPEATFPNDAQIWVPLAGDPAQPGRNYSWDGVARLKPGITIEAARQDLLRAHQGIWDTRDQDRAVSPRIMALDERLVGDLRPVAIALGGGVAIVLLIACVNVSSVLVARSAARGQETGIRRALGASSFRIARQHVVENILLSLAGAALGVLAGQWATALILAALPDDVPPWLRFDADARTVGFGLAAAAFTALLALIAPLLESRARMRAHRLPRVPVAAHR